jgi:hypothetical protein
MIESAVESELFPKGCVVESIVLLLSLLLVRVGGVKGMEVVADGCEEVDEMETETLLWG